jgi:hypothetical protein
MTDTSGTTADELEAQIDAQRAELADTVDQLAQKLDVKAQARARLEKIGPRHLAAAAAVVVAVGGLVWWRRRR